MNDINRQRNLPVADREASNLQSGQARQTCTMFGKPKRMSVAIPTKNGGTEDGSPKGQEEVSPTFVKLMKHIGYKSDVDISKLLRPNKRSTSSNLSPRKAT